MADIFTGAFWDEMEGDLWDAVGETVLSIYLAGVGGGIDALPKPIRVLANAETVNAGALAFLKEYRFKWVKGITDTTREKTVQIFNDWMRSGSPLPMLEQSLESVYGAARAETIASTESTRLYAQGNRDAWDDTGLVDEVIWQTVNDDRVCPICSDLNGTHVGIDDIDAYPPAHPRCHCYTLPVVSEDALANKLDEVLSD